MSNTAQRYLALDALRGLTIALMILVNSPGSWDFVYAPLLHANWHGCTPTDLVFPFFLFIVGSAMYFSFKKTDFQLDSFTAIKIVKRGLLIFVIGFALNGYPFVDPIDHYRVMGVLQRIGLAYILAAFIVLSFQRTGVLIVSVAILAAYSLLLLSVGESAYTLEDNIVRQFDIAILSAEHMYQGMGLAFDPEGVLSSLPSAVNVLVGFEVTRLISQYQQKKQSMIKLVQLGLTMALIGLIVDQFIPINKALWTGSYVVFTSGIACLVLAFFVYLIDIKMVKKPIQPLMVYGTNPLFVYVLSWLWVTSYLYIDIGSIDLYLWLFNFLDSFLTSKLASFIFAFSHVALFWWISKWLYQRQIFIKI